MVTKCKNVSTKLKPPANSLTFADIKWELPSGATYLGIAWYIAAQDNWAAKTTVCHQSVTTAGARLIINCSANINVTVITQVFYTIKP